MLRSVWGPSGGTGQLEFLRIWKCLHISRNFKQIWRRSVCEPGAGLVGWAGDWPPSCTHTPEDWFNVYLLFLWNACNRLEERMKTWPYGLPTTGMTPLVSNCPNLVEFTCSTGYVPMMAATWVSLNTLLMILWCRKVQGMYHGNIC